MSAGIASADDDTLGVPALGCANARCAVAQGQAAAAAVGLVRFGTVEEQVRVDGHFPRSRHVDVARELDDICVVTRLDNKYGINTEQIRDLLSIDCA